MSTAPADVARAAYDAFSTGDMEALGALLAPDTRWQIGDVPPLNGEYVGAEQVFGGFLGPLMELSGGTFRLEVHDLAGTDVHAMAVVHETAEREGRTLDAYHAHVFQVADGKVVRFWASTADPSADQAFWG